MSMLAIMGFGMVIVFLAFIMTKKLSAFTALIIVPICFGIIGGFTSNLGAMMLDGIKKLGPTGVMLIFAIMYFGIMINVGIFDPIVNKILKIVKGDPLKVIIGTAILASCISLDGDGSTTYMVTVTAMLPIYQRLGINPMILPTITILQNGIMNLIPWGGPTARVMTSLGLDNGDVFVPLVPGMIVATIWVIFVAYLFGRHERKRLGIINLDAAPEAVSVKVAESEELKRPNLFWINWGITILLMVALVAEWLPTPVLFTVGTAVILVINYPSLSQQQDRIRENAANALAVASVVFAAGIFNGILSGTKMIDAMAQSMIAVIPESMGPHLAIITALISAPVTYFISNDAFYFGIIPVIAKTASLYGINPAEIARASLMGQPVHMFSPLAPSAYLLVGICGVDFGSFTKFVILPAIGTALVMIAVALICGIFPF